MSNASTSSGFASLEALLVRNDELLASTESPNQSLSSVPKATIEDFMASAAATGAVIAGPRDRRRAQAIINFWAAELITRGKGGGEWVAPQLAAAERGPVDSGELASQQPPPSDSDLTRSRAQVRISASARQWLASGGDAGWLLSGDALHEAEEFIGEDDDIRALVVASRAAEHKATRRFRLGLGSISLVLFVLCVGLFLALQKSWVAERQATAAETVAKSERDAANAQSIDTAALNQTLQTTLAEQAQRGRKQQADLDQLQDALKRIAPIVKRAQESGEITDSDIPDAMRPILNALEQKALPQRSPLPADLSLLRGYDPTFLQSAAGGSKSSDSQSGGISVPLPTLTGLFDNAYENGQPIHYVNFSLVLSKARRSPIFTAVNMQRSAVIPLLRANVPFEYDPRVAQEAQPDPGAFGAVEIDRGQLVNAREIAWGPAFGTDAVAAGRTAYAMVSVMTNVTPQFNTFNRGLWSEVERYARDGFSRLSDRVTIFTGPVLAGDDPLIDDLRMPQRFWKVLVTTSPDNPASLLVEAFLVPQFGKDGAKIPATKFVPGIYRVRVADIERLAGLDFGEIVRAADRYWLSTPIQNSERCSSRNSGHRRADHQASSRHRPGSFGSHVGDAGTAGRDPRSGSRGKQCTQARRGYRCACQRQVICRAGARSPSPTSSPFLPPSRPIAGTPTDGSTLRPRLAALLLTQPPRWADVQEPRKPVRRSCSSSRNLAGSWLPGALSISSSQAWYATTPKTSRIN